jgi:hypothetical protein
MADGISLQGDSTSTSVALGSLPTFAPCFIDEITGAFAIWSAIADIQFEQVEDNGAPFNAAGATGDIRIAAHVFDGPSGILAHGFFPPPNGVSAAGDIHFDVAENWSCTPATGLDFGIVAAHEIGHAIGLSHETRTGGAGRPALMNPFYNPSVASLPLGDDINGAETIYGSAVGNSPDAIVDFDAYGLWILDYGQEWVQLHPLGADQVVTGDLDGSGVDDIIVDFGVAWGVWIRMNNADWFQLHTLSPRHMAVGDLDNSGRDDIVADFDGFGVWRWMNNGFWTQLHELNPTVFAIGNVDNLLGDDVVATFAGFGVWRWMNNATWVQLSSFDADQIAIGDLDETTSTADNADDIALHVPGQGLFYHLNLGSPVHLDVNVVRMAAGDIDGNGQDELVVDSGPASGIAIFDFARGVTQLHTLSSEDLILSDLDGNGQAEIVIDFGDGIGLWIVVNNSVWIQGHPLSPDGLAAGDLD